MSVHPVGRMRSGSMTRCFVLPLIATLLALTASGVVSAASEGGRVVPSRAAETGPLKAAVATLPPEATVPLMPPEATVPLGQAAVLAPPGKRAFAVIQDLRFDRGESQDRVIVLVPSGVVHKASQRSPTRSILEISGASLPRGLERTLDVGALGGLVRAASIYPKDGKVMVDVDHVAGVSGAVIRLGNALHYVFKRGAPDSATTGIAADGLPARRTRSLGSEPLVPFAHAMLGDSALADGSSGEWQSEPDQAGAFLPSSSPMQVEDRTRFTGKRIDLDLKEADLHNVFRILADVGNVNIVAADNVDGAVTIRMKNVPWDQALDTILRAKKLGQERRGNIVRIALQADLSREREIQVAELKSRLQLEPLEVRLVPISYATASDMQARAKEMLSPRGTLSVDERTNVLIAQDVAGNLNRVEELVRALDTQTPQVLIEARIVEATSRFQRDAGIQWGGDLNFGPATGNETGLIFPSAVSTVGGAHDDAAPTGGLSPNTPQIPNPNFAVNLPAAVGSGAGGAIGLTLGSIDNAVSLRVRLSAAETAGMLRVVSSPRILTLDNHEARINQGTLIPFSQVSAQGVQTVFQEARLQLLVVPHVTADGSVSMHVKVNRDEPDFNQTSARGDPTILRREAETDLIVRDGHTAVIGGIYTRNTGRNLDQVPILGDIPVLGVLFQRRRSSDTRSELVIFLTPRVVNRAEALGR
ncbi:MAG: type IV pilus secretin PilQ [Myxococcales bacterium]|nr:type IV pilus secretin PilQ [Myxococcales bacterium]